MEKGMTENDIIKIIEDKVPQYIPFIVMIKFHFINNSYFHMLSFFRIDFSRSSPFCRRPQRRNRSLCTGRRS